MSGRSRRGWIWLAWQIVLAAAIIVFMIFVLVQLVNMRVHRFR